MLMVFVEKAAIKLCKNGLAGQRGISQRKIALCYN